MTNRDHNSKQQIDLIHQQAIKDDSPGVAMDEVFDRLQRKYSELAL